MNGLPSKKVLELANYLKGFADASGNVQIKEASKYLEQLSGHICAGGFIGCQGGDKCTSSHK